ncbi:MAG TPA: TonB family protein [Bryobacteraceae bacterium]|nr:TonB family protein [Bryobacteraceae bacterium]
MRQHILPFLLFGAAGVCQQSDAPPAAPQSNSDRVFRVGGGVSAPKLLSKIEPNYTDEAQRLHLEGQVVLVVEIDPNGHAVHPRVVSSLGHGLDENAIEAVDKWKFQPGYKDGKPVTVAATIQVNFRLADNPRSSEEGIPLDQLNHLRSLPDEQWKDAIGKLARRIQRLEPSPAKTGLIAQLGNLVTEGDAGHDTLQVVASTMADVLRAAPNATSYNALYESLARLVRYEHCQASIDTPQYESAVAKLEMEEEHRRNADFTLSDLTGRRWALRDLRGKVVLVNFWATWCPPCRKEMPDLEALDQRFRSRGLVILGISDEDEEKVLRFITESKYSYPILLDPGRKVNELFAVEGIPQSFLYNREGKLVAQAIDRRTEQQFLAMLKQAGLE